MTFMGSLPERHLPLLETHLEEQRFAEGDCIIAQGSAGDGFYIIDQGQVRIEYDTGELDTDVVLRYLEPGAIMGEFALFDDQPRSANAYAHSDVVVRWLSTAAYKALCDQHPDVGVSLLSAFSRNLADMVRHYTGRLADFLTSEMTSAAVDAMVARAVAAQQAFVDLDWSEQQIDALLEEVAEAIAAEAESLAEQSVEVTGLGVVEDKVAKIRFAAMAVYDVLAGRPAGGLLAEDEQSKITQIASPVGVVLGLIPLTNPVPTMVFKALICLKARNALVMSCHRGALPVGNRAGEIIQRVLAAHGAPVELVQWIRERTSRRLTNLYMRHEDVSLILATGGPSMVHAAYSSGTPAIGVGSGNAPVWVAADADVEAAARMVIRSKGFDNGVICGSENNLVVDAGVRDAFLVALKANGALVVPPDAIEGFGETVFDADTRHPRRELIGKPATAIAEMAGLETETGVRLIVAPVGGDRVEGPFGREKLAPMLSLFTVTGEEEAIALCRRILANEGAGHTAIIHTRDQALVRRFGLAMPVSRVLVNAPGAQGCIGLGTGLTPSLTLGCGTWGSTSTTDNVSYANLLNVKRIAQAL